MRTALFLTFSILAFGDGTMAQERNMSANELGTATGSSITFRNLRPMASISRDGEVVIDWEVVEQTAADQKSDPTNRSYAQLMIAIRDHTWKAPN